ncbi:MAG: hypothetical protein NVSMB1_20540 [Polyangiales bacterium]
MVSGIGGPGGAGKIGGPAPSIPTSPDLQSTAVDRKSFGDSLAEARGVSKAERTTPLEKLRARDIDLDGYVDARVRDATSHLEGVLSPSDVDKIREDLRELIANDPDIAALVKAAEVAG